VELNRTNQQQDHFSEVGPNNNQMLVEEYLGQVDHFSEVSKTNSNNNNLHPLEQINNNNSGNNNNSNNKWVKLILMI